VLDCCHAGAATSERSAPIPVEDAAEIQPDNCLILMGSKRVQPVSEFDDIGGTFLGTALRAALGERFHEADGDRDERLSFKDLVAWLDSSWKALEGGRRALVPAPHHFGAHAGELYLTPKYAPWTPASVTWP